MCWLLIQSCCVGPWSSSVCSGPALAFWNPFLSMWLWWSPKTLAASSPLVVPQPQAAAAFSAYMASSTGHAHHCCCLHLPFLGSSACKQALPYLEVESHPGCHLSQLEPLWTPVSGLIKGPLKCHLEVMKRRYSLGHVLVVTPHGTSLGVLYLKTQWSRISKIQSSEHYQETRIPYWAQMEDSDLRVGGIDCRQEWHVMANSWR